MSDLFATKADLISIAQDMTDKINLSCGASLPIGSVVPFMGTTAPQDFLACDGTVYNISDYPALAAEFESEYGTKNHFGGDGVTTFAVPTLTGAPTGSIFVIKSQNSPSSGLIDYSTSERVVGTWIDGKTVYEKLVVENLPTNGQGYEFPLSDYGITNVDFVWLDKAIANGPAFDVIANPVAFSNSGTMNFKALIVGTKTKISCYNNMGENARVIFFVRYTKAS